MTSHARPPRGHARDCQLRVGRPLRGDERLAQMRRARRRRTPRARRCAGRASRSAGNIDVARREHPARLDRRVDDDDAVVGVEHVDVVSAVGAVPSARRASRATSPASRTTRRMRSRATRNAGRRWCSKTIVTRPLSSPRSFAIARVERHARVDLGLVVARAACRCSRRRRAPTRCATGPRASGQAPSSSASPARLPRRASTPSARPQELARCPPLARSS